MSDSEKQRTRLETKALIIGYAMSRLDHVYLSAQDAKSWSGAYRQASECLGVTEASFNNLRDEFDPFHPNPRKGWHKRPLRSSRQRIIDELSDVSDDALLELVARILLKDETSIEEAVDSLAVVTNVASNVAERLLTGRRAEEYFLQHCRSLVGVEPEDLIDQRNAACGYDFGVRDAPLSALEVKGLKQVRGQIQFTDREWLEAKLRKADYRLIVVGNLAQLSPRAIVIPNPYYALDAHCRYQTTISALWRTTVSV